MSQTTMIWQIGCAVILAWSAIQSTAFAIDVNATDILKPRNTSLVALLMKPLLTLNNGEILIQQHNGGGVFFRKSWTEFKNGFGEMTGDYWFGNEGLYWLTDSGHYRLRVDMLAKNDQRWYYAEYSTFKVADEASGYRLTVGGYSGTAGDSMAYVNGGRFSTRDRDQDLWSDSCTNHANYGNGAGFWYTECAWCFPNSPDGGLYSFGWYSLPIGSGWSDRKLLYIRMSIKLIA